MCVCVLNWCIGIGKRNKRNEDGKLLLCTPNVSVGRWLKVGLWWMFCVVTEFEIAKIVALPAQAQCQKKHLMRQFLEYMNEFK